MASFPLLCWIVLAAFLGCLGLFALAVTKVVAPDGQGHSRGFFGGLAALVALVFLGGLGVAGLGATVVAIGLGSAVDWNPIRRIEIERSGTGGDAAAALRSPDSEGRARRRSAPEESAVRARVTVRGDAGNEVAELLADLVEFDPRDVENALTIHRGTDADGREFEVFEFRLPISERDLAELEEELEREIEGLDLHLPASVDVEFAGRR